MSPPQVSFLQEAYPLLFRKSPEVTCGDGWFPLINEASAKIEAILREVCGSPEKIQEVIANPKYEDLIFIFQIKEKFGGLRYNLWGNWETMTEEQGDLIYQILDDLESASRTVCEVCGTSGLTRKIKLFHTTLCDSHYQEICDGMEKKK